MNAALGPSNAELTVRTGRAGMAAKAGHDLLLVASRWAGSLAIDAADPSRSSLALTVEAAGLEVREGSGGVKPLTAGDREEIKGNLAKKILHIGRHPEISFVSRAIAPTSNGSHSVSGDLTLVGTTRPIRFDLHVAPNGNSSALSASVALEQTDFGIKPFSALMGALKVADRVEVRVEARIPAG